jgi:hypothetical protein
VNFPNFESLRTSFILEAQRRAAFLFAGASVTFYTITGLSTTLADLTVMAKNWPHSGRAIAEAFEPLIDVVLSHLWTASAVALNQLCATRWQYTAK